MSNATTPSAALIASATAAGASNASGGPSEKWNHDCWPAHAMAQHMQRGAAPPPADGGPTPGETKPKDDVIDAEFEVKK